jgi:hypothetical protein
MSGIRRIARPHGGFPAVPRATPSPTYTGPMLRASFILVVLIGVFGCGNRFTNNVDGTFVSDEQIVRIEEAKTGADWLRLMLGPPDEVRAEGNTKIWVYNYHETHINHRKDNDQQWFNRVTFISVNPDGSVGRVWSTQSQSEGWQTRFE